MLPPEHLSVSQIETYSDCGLKYRLSRVDGVSETPAWWNVGGTAVHRAAEVYERARHAGQPLTPDDVASVFHESFQAQVKDFLTTYGDGDFGLSPDSPRWRAAKRGTEDGAWWAEHGEFMARLYVEQQQDRGFEILVLDSVPVIEHSFQMLVAGVPVKGYIDQVFKMDDGRILIRDLKAGARKPDSTFQLGVYGLVFPDVEGVDACYYMARTGVCTAVIDTRASHPLSTIEYRALMTAMGKQYGIYPPRISAFCGSCGVRSGCPMWPT